VPSIGAGITFCASAKNTGDILVKRERSPRQIFHSFPEQNQTPNSKCRQKSKLEPLTRLQLNPKAAKKEALIQIAIERY